MIQKGDSHVMGSASGSVLMSSSTTTRAASR